MSFLLESPHYYVIHHPLGVDKVRMVDGEWRIISLLREEKEKDAEDS